ncbi:MAG: 4Fe-4S binding protein [Promethearchaeota archaeon]
MDEVNNYEKIRQKLKLGGIYAPNHKKVDQLLRILWTEEEVEILALFNDCTQATTLRDLQKRTCLSRDEIKQRLRTPLWKRTISRIGTNKYYLLPLVPGIFEQYFIMRRDTEENHKKVAKIYRFLFKEFLPGFYAENENFKLFRSRLPSNAEEKLIKVNQEFDIEQKILPYESILEVIDKNEYFMTVPCQCRLIGELSGEPCEVASADLGCFISGAMAKEAIQHGYPGMTKEEALEFIKKTEKAGLIHSCVADSSNESTLFVCNCCSCHCGGYIGAKETHTHAGIPSNFIPQFNNEICTNCELCLKKCPMGAIYHHWPDATDKSDDYMILKEEKCIGCGVCASTCPNNAINLVKVRDNDFKEKHKIGNRLFSELLM